MLGKVDETNSKRKRKRRNIETFTKRKRLTFWRVAVLSWQLMNLIASWTSQQLREAAELKEQIAALERQLQQLLNGSAAPERGAKPVKRQMSAAARAKIAKAQRLRWAKTRDQGEVKVESKGKGAGKQGQMSAAAKAKLSARMKAIWAARRAAAKKK